jgi:2-phospho-L-lactate guanylyltransferase
MSSLSEKPHIIWAVLPIKGLTDVKSRLGDVLSSQERRGLVGAMADDVLTALRGVGRLAGIAIISHDPDVRDWALARDVTLIDDSQAEGLSAAVALAGRALKDQGATAMLSVLADTPFATTEDFSALLTAARKTRTGPQLVIAPSRDGDGSNALLVEPPDAMAFHYGQGSHQAHRLEAKSQGLVTSELDLEGLGHDIDTPQDLADLVAKAEKLPKGSQTKQFLTQHQIAGRLK